MALLVERVLPITAMAIHYAAVSVLREWSTLKSGKSRENTRSPFKPNGLRPLFAVKAISWPAAVGA